MKIAILGFDIEGRASYEYYLAAGHEITICDQNPEVHIPDGAASQLGDAYLDNLARFDLLLRTPGLHPAKILEKNPDVSDKIWSGTNEFLKVCPTRNIIGVTGTKGKGTTSTLITKMLTEAGFRVHLAGNIGRAALDVLPEVQPDDWVVLELSNFQLIDLKQSPHISVCLMVVPEHLDWHKDATEYYAAKANIFNHQNSDDVAIYYHDNGVSSELARKSKAHLIPYLLEPGAYCKEDTIVISDVAIMNTSEIKLLGHHNIQNACAAITAVWRVTQDAGAVRRVLLTFSGLEHRLEFVREIGDIKYYNDSFGTTPETAIVALQAFSEPKIVILGGSDKGANYDTLAKTVLEHNVREVILVGNTAPEIKKSLDAVGYLHYTDGPETMKDIVSLAIRYAQPGDIVLLSTGCASFGLFKNYKDRGNQFKQTVNAL
jgi:UDP-N-acetylmuramoylalanine--D-glutamate ligase